MKAATAKKDETVWVLTHVYDKNSDAVSELYSGTEREVVEKIVDEFALGELNDKIKSMSALMEYLDETWYLVDLKLLKVK
jgi:hypothetical protein